MEHVESVKYMGHEYTFLIEKNQKEKVHLADPGVSEWIILKCKGMIVGLATVLILLRMEIIGGLL